MNDNLSDIADVVRRLREIADELERISYVVRSDLRRGRREHADLVAQAMSECPRCGEPAERVERSRVMRRDLAGPQTVEYDVCVCRCGHEWDPDPVDDEPDVDMMRECGLEESP